MAALKKPKLSNKPSEMIRQALTDLAAVEKSKNHRINMNVYHAKRSVYKNVDEIDWKESEKCQVCFAGAVIAQAGNDPSLEIAPEEFDNKTYCKLRALDRFRCGEIADGLDFLGIEHPKFLTQSVTIPEYSDDKKQFKKDLLELSDVLEGVGL